ncbi:hypothetical protein DH2020_032535 [Rehmannia glutinosa]|uniref:Uncharacterized protein n=1 Tax=Rehmannia glutinosa TaxID=99300 RepID=A0ABR0VF77_REHGL
MQNSFKATAVPQHISLTNSDVYSHSLSPFYLRGDGSGRNATNGTMYNSMKASSGSVVSSNLQFGGLTNSLGSADQMGSSNRGVGLMLQRGGNVILGFGGSLGNGQFENWTDNSGVVADHSQQTDNTSTDTDAKNQFPGVHHERLIVEDSTDQSKGRIGDQKAYVQQLENSRQRLVQLEQDLKRARQQGVYVAPGFSGDQSHSMGGSEHQRLVNDLRSAVNSHVGDGELQLVVDKVLGNQIEPLTEQQLVGICNLQQSSQQTEDALSQGMEALQQSLVDTLSSNSLAPRNSGNIADYMGQMAIAMSKLATLENFVHRSTTGDIGAWLLEIEIFLRCFLIVVRIGRCSYGNEFYAEVMGRGRGFYSGSEKDGGKRISRRSRRKREVDLADHCRVPRA